MSNFEQLLVRAVNLYYILIENLSYLSYYKSNNQLISIKIMFLEHKANYLNMILFSIITNGNDDCIRLYLYKNN